MFMSPIDASREWEEYGLSGTQERDLVDKFSNGSSLSDVDRALLARIALALEDISISLDPEKRAERSNSRATEARMLNARKARARLDQRKYDRLKPLIDRRLKLVAEYASDLPYWLHEGIEFGIHRLAWNYVKCPMIGQRQRFNRAMREPLETLHTVTLPGIGPVKKGKWIKALEAKQANGSAVAGKKL